MTSPTARSLALLRAAGFLAEKVEYWNPYAKVRHDLFGFADILAIGPELKGVLAVQSTTRAHQAGRIAKIMALYAAKRWVAAGNRIVVHGWAKVGPRGKAKQWEVTVAEAEPQ